MISRIFVPYDFTKPSEKAFKKALKIAKENKASIAVVLFLKTDVFFHGSWYEYEVTTAAANELAKIEFNKEIVKLYKECQDAKVPLWADTIGSTAPEKGILKFAKENKIDLIVMGSRGRKGWTKKILGSVSAKVKKMKLPCKLMIVEN